MRHADRTLARMCAVDTAAAAGYVCSFVSCKGSHRQKDTWYGREATYTVSSK